MATKKSPAAKNKTLDRSAIVSAYMTYVLEHEKKPASVYGFCQENNMLESEFYQFFGNIDALEKGVWEDFYTHTMALLEKGSDFTQSSSRDKML